MHLVVVVAGGVCTNQQQRLIQVTHQRDIISISKGSWTRIGSFSVQNRSANGGNKLIESKIARGMQ